MAAKQEIEELRESIKAHDRQIDGLIRAFEAEHKTVSALAASVVHHDNQIEANERQIEKLIAQFDNLGRQLQAYLNRLPPQ